MKITLFLLILFPWISTPVLAEDIQIRRALPVVETQEINKVQYKCLNTDQWKDVLLLANDYQGLFNWRLQMEGVLKAQETLVEAYELKIGNYEAMLKIREADRKFLTDELKRIDEKNKRQAFEERLEKYGLWAIVLVETITIGILGAKSWVASH
jgi:hypothetical protein